MTQKEKQLLIKDLYARLPYNVKGRYCLYDSNGNLTDCGNEPEIVENIDLQKEKIWTDNTVQGYYLDEFKIYLRPMSSMTEDEEDELNSARMGNYGEDVDWLNAHHFDYRIDPSTGKTLIESGLALKAPEDMYKNN